MFKDCCLACAVSILAASSSVAAEQPGPIHVWHFDETEGDLLLDATADPIDLKLHDGAKRVDGRFGSAIQTGGGGYVEGPGLGAMEAGAIELWVKLLEACGPGQVGIIGFGNPYGKQSDMALLGGNACEEILIHWGRAAQQRQRRQLLGNLIEHLQRPVDHGSPDDCGCVIGKAAQHIGRQDQALRVYAVSPATAVLETGRCRAWHAIGATRQRMEVDARSIRPKVEKRIVRRLFWRHREGKPTKTGAGQAKTPSLPKKRGPRQINN